VKSVERQPSVEKVVEKVVEIVENREELENNVEILEIELNDLPGDISKEELKKTLFQN